MMELETILTNKKKRVLLSDPEHLRIVTSYFQHIKSEGSYFMRYERNEI